MVAVTDEARLPVICGESDPVRAGGLATLGIDYYKLGEQTGVMAAEILSGKGKPQTMPVQMQKEFKDVYKRQLQTMVHVAYKVDDLDEQVRCV